MSQTVEIEDRRVTYALDGSELMQREIQLLSRFLATDRWDQMSRQGLSPNYCNDGVIRIDLLKNGLAQLIVSRYFEQLKPSFESRLERIKRYRPYAHSEAPFLSATAIWDRFVPGLNNALNDLQKEGSFSPKTFEQLVQLHDLEARCPAEWLRRLLFYQQQQHSWLKPDSRLESEDLSLFGFHSLLDWFGNDFLDLSAEFILNAARVAEMKGYRVSLEEAKADLINQFTFTVKKIKESNPKGAVDLNFHQHLRTLGFDEKTAATVWRDVLLFRRYFQGVGQAVIIDRLPYSDFASYALEENVVQLYEWPAALKIKEFSELLQLQFYVEAISQERNILTFPNETLALEAVETSHPELIQTVYTAKIAKANKEAIGLRASMKEVLEWQLVDENWALLLKQFPALSNGKGREERFEALNQLSAVQRGAIDAFARKALVDTHSDWVEMTLVSTGAEEEIAISKGSVSLPYIRKVENFTATLESAALTGLPVRYSDDGATYYQLSDVKLKQEKHLLTFEEARMKGVLEQQLQALLEKKYTEIRVNHPETFKNEEGKWKSFPEVKDQVGALVYADLLKAIDRAEPKEWELGAGPLDSYVARRFLPHTRKAWAALKQNPLDSQWIQNESEETLATQFKLQQKEHLIQRTGKEDWMNDETPAYLPNQWSPIHVATGEISFFYFKDKRPHRAPILEQLVMGKETIAADAQRFLAENLLEELIQHQAIVIPIQGDKK